MRQSEKRRVPFLLAAATVALTLLAAARPCHAQGAGKVSMQDINFFACRSYDDGGTLATEVAVDGEWVPMDGDLVVEISERSTIASVTGSFEPQAGHEQRVRWRAEGASAWGAWTPWSAGRTLHTTDVPDAGDVNADEYEIEMRATGGTRTIAVHGYVKIKKLNSGG